MTPTKNNLKISLIIPAYNEEDYIEECLEEAIKHSNEKFHEIIVIDNGSTDRTRELAEKFPGIKVVHEPIKGLTRARQRGLEVATGDLLAYIDADTRLHPLWIKIAENFFDKHPDAVSLSGPYRYYDGSIFRNGFQHILWWLNAPIAYYTAGYMILGGNFIAKKDALLKMGGFDKTIEFYGEDTNISKRLSEHGKVAFKMDFFIYSSSRRFQKDGIIKTNINYALNFIWPAIFGHSYTNTKNYSDPRPLPKSEEGDPIFNLNKRNANIKAWVVTICFSLAFIITWAVESFSWRSALPLTIFYIVFMFNTFFSVRQFSSITPPYNLAQGVLDFILASLYIATAVNIDDPRYFIFFVLLIFALSVVKYTLLLGVIDYDSVLKRKILINMSGVCGCAIVLGGIFSGWIRASLWMWAVAFVLANVILFTLWPFYRIHGPDSK